MKKVDQISQLGETLLILHFSGHGFNNQAAEACFGDTDTIKIRDRVNELSASCPNLWILTIYDVCQDFDLNRSADSASAT